MRIIGIDPGTTITGIGIVEHRNGKVYLIHYDTISLNSKEPLPDRLKKIYDECLQCIEEYRPDEFAIETAFYGKNIQSTLKLGQARGVAIIAALNCNLKISEYSPREVKKSVTGNGASSKVQVQYMVKSILSIAAGNEIIEVDSSDALAVALCHFYCSQNILSGGGAKKNNTSWKFFAEQNPERIMIKNR
ncbi:MAG: crossover junction endodeoxyribonuclease RuvC [Ignavibacteria bacterium]